MYIYTVYIYTVYININIYLLLIFICIYVYLLIVYIYIYINICLYTYIFMFMQHSCRLTAQLMETTWNQIELQVEEDLMKMRQWASQFHLFASQQACLFALLYVCVCVFSLGRDVFHVFFIGILAGWLGYAILESAVQQGQGGCGTADGEAAYHCYPPEHQPSPWRYRGEASIAWTSSAP